MTLIQPHLRLSSLLSSDTLSYSSSRCVESSPSIFSLRFHKRALSLTFCHLAETKGLSTEAEESKLSAINHVQLILMCGKELECLASTWLFNTKWCQHRCTESVRECISFVSGYNLDQT